MKIQLIGSCNSCGFTWMNLQFQKIAEAGFKNVEVIASQFRLHCFVPEVMVDEPWYGSWYLSVADLKSLLSGLGLQPLLVLSECDFLDPFGEALGLRRVDFAVKLGARYLCVAQVPKTTPGAERGLVWALQRMADYAQARGVTLLIETLCWVFRNARESNRMLAMIQRDNVKIMYNLAHALTKNQGLDPAEEVARLGENLGGLFLKDSSGADPVGAKRSDRNYVWDFPVLGQGKVNFPAVFARLADFPGELPCVVQLEGGPHTQGYTLDHYQRDMVKALDYLRALGLEF